MYTLWLGFTNFPKTLKPFKKPRCQKSEIQEVNNLNFTHCLGVLAEKTWKHLDYGCHLTHSCMWLALMGTLERHSLYVLEAVHIEMLTVIMEKIKYEVLSVSKPVARCQTYVHIKTYLAKRYIPIAWGQVKMTFIPAPGKANVQRYPISLLTFMKKTMQKLAARHIRDESSGYVPYIDNNLPSNKGSPQKLHASYTGSCGKQVSYFWAFLDIEGASDSNSCEVRKAAKWHGLGDTVALDWLYAGWQKN